MKFQTTLLFKTFILWTLAIVLGVTCFKRNVAQAQALSSFSHMRHSFELRTSTRYHFDEMPLSGWTYDEGATIDPRLNFSYQFRVNKTSLLSAKADVFYNLQPIPGRLNFYTERFYPLLNFVYQREFIQLKRAVYGSGVGISYQFGHKDVYTYTSYGARTKQSGISYNALGINVCAFFKFPLWRRWHLVATTDFSPYLKVLNHRLGHPFHIPENQYLWRMHVGLGYKVGRIPKKYVSPSKHS